MAPVNAQPLVSPVVAPRRWSSRTHRWLSGLAWLCFALTVVAYFAADTYYRVDRVLPSAVGLACATALLAGATAFDAHRGERRWTVPTMIVGPVVLIGLVALSVPWVGTGQVSAARSPDGRSTVVVTEALAVIDPVWEVRVRQNSGLLARQWYAGCVNGDDPNNTFKGIAWINDTTFEVLTDTGQPQRVSIDPAGHAIGTVSTGDDICP